jgi:RHS repeat-associated protein
MPITDYYVASDAMGSVTAILDEDGNVLERRNYDAFGEMTCMTPDGTQVTESPTGVDVGFQGQIRDDMTGLYQMGYRWYNPVLGRWISCDPIGLIGGLNFSTFADNTPTIKSDVSGLTCLSNLEFLITWALGMGNPSVNYKDNDIQQKEMIDSPGAKALRDEFYKTCSNVYNFNYGSFKAFKETIGSPCSTGFQVGGFGNASATRNSNCTVTFVIKNVAGTHSFFYHAVGNMPDEIGFDYSLALQLPNFAINLQINLKLQPPGRNITQTFEWTEKIDRCRCAC